MRLVRIGQEALGRRSPVMREGWKDEMQLTYPRLWIMVFPRRLDRRRRGPRSAVPEHRRPFSSRPRLLVRGKLNEKRALSPSYFVSILYVRA